MLQSDGGGTRFVILYGSNGTGKTIVLFQCLVMQISKFRFDQQPFEVLVMVGSESIKDPICGTDSLRHGLKHCGTPDCDGSELLFDLKTRYLDSYHQLKDIEPTTFEKACKSNCHMVYYIKE